MHGVHRVFEAVPDQREAVRRRGSESLRLHVCGYHERAGMDVLGKGGDNLLDRFGRERIGQPVVALIAPGGEHLLLREIQFFACGLFEPSCCLRCIPCERHG